MFKRFVALLLAVLTLVPAAASASVPGLLNQKMATRSGPSTKYTEELGTFPQSTPITVIAQIETNGTVWYQVEFTYNSMLYRAYTGKKRVDGIGVDSVPWESPRYTDDVTVTWATAYYGPGEQYATRRQTVDKGTAVRVFQVEGEWALCDYREGSQWARGYIRVSDLRNTAPAPVTEAPAPPPAAATAAPALNIIDRDQKLCIDYYGQVFCYAGHDESFAQLVGLLPVMSYFDGVPCIRSHTDVYTGPGYNYWRRWIPGTGYPQTGKLDTNLRIYGRQNGWIMIRYPSDANGGYRYGWVIPEAISVENQNRTPQADFAALPVVTTRFVYATEDPDRSLEIEGFSVMAQVTVTALAFLDANRDWTYCEFNLSEGNSTYIARGFLPTDALQLK